MLGKRSRPLLRTTTSKLSFPQGEECDQNAVNAPVCGKHAFVPQHVMVGFDIPQEIKPSDLCESPRSVLDVNVLPGRSFRSYVRALPLQNRGSQGVGLAIIVDIHAEEKGDHGSLSHVGHNPASIMCEQALHHEVNSTSACLQSHRRHHHHHHHHHHQPSLPIAIATNCRSQDEPSTYKLSKYVQSSGSDNDLSSVGSVLDMDLVDSDYSSAQQEYVVHIRTSCNTDNDEDYIPRPSIFSVGSFPSSYGSFGIQSVSFLDACALCQRAFTPGKDIFMYRGDQAFCSAECRGERIKIDEYKEKLMTFKNL